MTDYDRWKTQGRWQTCDICRVRWCEADGGCACDICPDCGAQYREVCWTCVDLEYQEQDEEE